jgi:hypothetical protein
MGDHLGYQSPISSLDLFPSGTKTPAWLEFTRVMVRGESASLGCAAPIAFFAALVFFAGGSKWLLGGLLLLGATAMLAGLAGLFWLLSTRLSVAPSWWNLLVGCLQVPLMIVGVWLLELVVNYQPGTARNPGTDGPFADGSAGLMALMGYSLLVGGALILILLAWGGFRHLMRRYHSM